MEEAAQDFHETRAVQMLPLEQFESDSISNRADFFFFTKSVRSYTARRAYSSFSILVASAKRERTVSRHQSLRGQKKKKKSALALSDVVDERVAARGVRAASSGRAQETRKKEICSCAISEDTDTTSPPPG